MKRMPAKDPGYGDVSQVMSQLALFRIPASEF
jgi:hypothetical protein